MSDIIERLRDPATSAITVEEAADEIERLRGLYDSATDQAVRYADENARLTAALQATVDAIAHVQKHLIHHSPPQDAVMNGALAIARRALESMP